MTGAAKMMMIRQARGNEGGNRMEGQNQGEYYPPRDERRYMGEDPEMRRRRDSRGRYAEDDDGPEMRRRRDSRGRYMEGNDGPEMRGTYNAGDYMGDMPESRFRDRRGREHYDNGRFAPMRGEGDEGAEMRSYNGEYDPESRRRRGRYAEMEESPEMRRSNMYALPRNERPAGLIGFMGQDERRMEHGEHRRQEQRMGKTSGGQEFDHETAKEWTDMMKNADGTKGAKWTMEQAKPYMSQIGFKGEEVEFWAVMNAMYSDYCAVMKRFGVDRPEVYAALAKAWLEDKDAVEDKAMMYWECIVEH